MKKITSNTHEDVFVRKYRLGDMWSNDFDYIGMLNKGLRVTVKTKLSSLQKLFDSFEDVNYHTASSPLWEALVKLKKGDTDITKCLVEFRELIKKELETSV